MLDLGKLKTYYTTSYKVIISICTSSKCQHFKGITVASTRHLGVFERNPRPNHMVKKIDTYTVSAQIRGRRLIKILGFYGGGLLQFLPKNAPKSLKKGTFGPKKWWLIGISE